MFRSVLSETEPLDSIDATFLMSEIYETRYGIFNHIANSKTPGIRKRPLASVAFHPSEDFTSGSMLEDSMRLYSEYPIYDLFKIDYPTFMKMPVDVAKSMIELAKERRNKEAKIAQAASSNLNAATAVNSSSTAKRAFYSKKKK